MIIQSSVAHLHGAAARGVVPVDVQLDVTSRCNQKCGFCYKPKARTEIDTTLILRALDELATMGTLHLQITGGEPMTHRDVWRILFHATARNYAIRLSTNGVLLDQPTIARLLHTNVHRLQMSLLGPTAEIHDRLAGRKGAFDKVLHALSLLRETRIAHRLSCPITKDVLPVVNEMRALAERIGVILRFDYRILPPRRYDSFGTMIPSDNEIRDLLVANPELGRAFVEEGLRRDQPQLNDTVCAAGITRLNIDEQGRLYACRLVQKCAGSVQDGVAEVWHESPILQELRRMKFGDLPCAKCPVLKWCVPCVGINLRDRGAMDKPSDEVCRFARIRAELASTLYHSSINEG